MPKRINPIAQYLICLAMTIIAYSIYARYAVPLIEGPPNLVKRRQSTANVDAQTSADRKQQYKRLFADDAWELGTSNMLQTAQGKILFQDYSTEPDGTLIVFPFTLIMDSKSGADDTESNAEPMVLRCLDEARIKFDRPFTIGSSDQSNGTGRMERATLSGDVLIYRLASSSKQDDSMRINTRNVQIEKQNIYALEKVDFQFGPHRGQGRNLLIEMAHAGPVNPITADFSQVEGIQRIELAFLDQMRIEPEQRNTSPTAEPMTTPNGLLSVSKSSPLDIFCNGPFVFDIIKKTIVLRDQVVVKQIDQFGDNLNCEILTLFLEGDEQTTINPMKGASSGLQLKQITAVGTPAIINAHSRNSRISGDQLDYDLKKNQIVARSETGKVTIVNEQYHFDSKSFQYSIPKDKSIGPLTAWGPGSMLRKATREREEFRASWKDKLTVGDEPNGAKLIQLDGNSKVAINQDTRIDANHLRFWLWPVPETNVAQDGSRPNSKRDYKPVKLVAYDDVKIDSPKLTGTTRQLTATWPQPETVSQTRFPGVTSLESNQVQVRRPAYQDSYATARTEMIAPVNRKSQFKLAGFTAPLKRERKFRVDGDRIDAQLSSQESGSEIRQVKIEGNVFIEEIVTQNPGDKPLKVVGHQLDMMPLGQDTYRIFVVGSPSRQAIVDAEGLHLTGHRLEVLPQGAELYRVKVIGSQLQQAIIVADGLVLEGVAVHLDQSANKLWVEGAGKMQMTPRSPDPNAQRKNTQIGKAPAQIDVSWGGGMVFDGRTIYFEQDVIMQASQKTQRATTRKTKSLSQALSVQLKQRVDFQSLSNESRKPDHEIEIEELILVNHLNNAQRVFQLVGFNNGANHPQPIVVENQDFDEAGKLVQKQKVLVPRATVKMATGSITAAGPGTIMNHRIGKSSFSPIGQLRQTTQNSNGLSYIQVNFDGSLVANMESQDMQISGNVRTLYTPIQNWNQTLNPDVITQIPTGAVKLTCEKIEMSKWEPRGATEPKNELIATGNAHIYGDVFEATSHRVSYDQLTDLLIIEGTPRTEANLWYQQNPRSASRDHLVAGKILYRISDQWTKVQKIKNGSFSPGRSR